jgi:hypothetical protein
MGVEITALLKDFADSRIVKRDLDCFKKSDPEYDKCMNIFFMTYEMAKGYNMSDIQCPNTAIYMVDDIDDETSDTVMERIRGVFTEEPGLPATGLRRGVLPLPRRFKGLTTLEMDDIYSKKV